MRVVLCLIAVVVTVAGCNYESVAPGGGGNGNISAPTNLGYELEPSGDPKRPLGILLIWDDVPDASLASYRVYSRASTGNSYGLRGETTSNTFHDNGVPHLEYLVTAVDVDGFESANSNVITVDERLQLVSPAWINSISLNGAIHLSGTTPRISPLPRGSSGIGSTARRTISTSVCAAPIGCSKAPPWLPSSSPARWRTACLGASAFPE
jgi:hypothetical protein